uniref:Uncharacterized protein n=1 Tax=Guillardia theta TaxID=55529 RepID=A0A7S4UVE3_GUITH|mmetsp:Transcript_48644/g.152722  ORF Transcript_48644/g.152722 Transcript_48644/m.152722 type:complete len:894 (+) Transcript_48644:230-2911(+)
MAFVHGPVRIYPQLEEVTVDQDLPNQVNSTNNHLYGNQSEAANNHGSWRHSCFSVCLPCWSQRGSSTQVATVELENYQSFTTFWSCREDGNFQERIHAEMHKLMFDQDMFHCIKLFQGEMMTWKRIPHYSQCQHHMQAACVHNDKSRWASDLASSFSFVPIFTSLHDQNTLQELATIQPELGQDREDKMLAEMLAALYLIYNNDRGSSQIKVVAPVLLSDGSKTISAEDLNKLSNLPSTLTCNLAATELANIGCGKMSEICDNLHRWSIKQVVLEFFSEFKSNAADDLRELRICPTQICYFQQPLCVQGNLNSDLEFEWLQNMNSLLKGSFMNYLENKITEYMKHNTYGAELNKIIHEIGLDGRFKDVFSMFEAPFKTPFDKVFKSGFLEECFIAGKCRVYDTDVLPVTFPAEESVQKLRANRDQMENDDRMKDLRTRFFTFKDVEADGILAMMTTNCIETGILKLPTQAAMLGLCGLYCTYGYYQFHLLFTEDRWLFQPNKQVPHEPKTFRWTRVCDPLVNYSWAVGIFIGIFTASRVSAVRGKMVIFGVVWFGAIVYFLSGCLDYIQCRFVGDGIGASCNGNWSLSASFCVFTALYCAYFAQKYIWVVLYILQGGYCIYTTTMGHITPFWAVIMFRVYGGTLFALVVLIIVRYRVSLVHAYNGILKHTTRIEQAWDRIIERDSEVLLDIASKSRAINRAIKSGFARARKQRKLSMTLTCNGSRRSRFSTRGKILQIPTKIQSVYDAAQLVSPHFQLFMKKWNQVGKYYSGTLKTSSRAIQKAVRSYDRDASCLTDLVRCTIIVKTLTDLNEWLERLEVYSEVATQLLPEEEEEEKKEKVESRMSSDLGQRRRGWKAIRRGGSLSTRMDSHPQRLCQDGRWRIISTRRAKGK